MTESTGDDVPKTTVLLDRWHDGDEQALDALLRDHLDWIRRSVGERIGGRLREFMETGDVVQETVLEFLRYGPRIRIEDGRRFRALLARIVENVLCGNHRWWSARRRDMARRQPARPESLIEIPDEGGVGPDEALIREQQTEWVRLGMELLEPGERDVLVLRDFDGLTHAAIAVRLGVSEEAAKKRYQRAVGTLGRIVAGLQRGRLPGRPVSDDTDGVRDSR